MVDSLSSDSITKKEYESIIGLIATRVDEIWKYILEASKRRLDWYAFQNDVYDGHGNGSSGGAFDPVADAEYIEFTGEFGRIYENDYYPYNEGFPTRFLWEVNYQDEVEFTIKDAEFKNDSKKDDKKQKRLALKAKREELSKSIKSKLTKEELKCVTFKK